MVRKCEKSALQQVQFNLDLAAVTASARFAPRDHKAILQNGRKCGVRCSDLLDAVQLFLQLAGVTALASMSPCLHRAVIPDGSKRTPSCLDLPDLC